jgi:hypothetical protein
MTRRSRGLVAAGSYCERELAGERVADAQTLIRASIDHAVSGMCARSWDTMVCINIQGMLAIVPWVPVMPERWRGDESAK